MARKYELKEDGSYVKYIVRKSPTAVTVVKRHFNKFGIADKPELDKIGIINFDAEETSKQEVFEYAQTREWKLSDEPTSMSQTGTPFYKAIDVGKLPEGELHDVEEGTLAHN